MALQGKLSELSVGDLVQLYCQDRRMAAITIHHQGRQAQLYFNDGALQHAELDGREGEDVLFELLHWHEGDFQVEGEVAPPKVSITRAWASLLLEGARRLDEAQSVDQTADQELDLFSQGEPMATEKKSEQLAALLNKLLQESSDITGVAIVGTDGLVYSANVPQRDLDEDMVGAVSAAIAGLCRRSANQLKRGGFKQTLIQGEDGNIVVSPINDEALFVGLTPATVNLGMAFAEMRSMTGKIREVL